MILLQLFWTFFKVGAFTFGGGYAMIPMIESEMLSRIHIWLPFSHAVDAVKLAAGGEIGAVLPHVLWVLGYAAVLYVAAIAVFKRRMKQS